MDASQQESCELSECTEHVQRSDRGFQRHGAFRVRGLFSIFLFKEGESDIGDKGHCSFNSQKLRLPCCRKSQS